MPSLEALPQACSIAWENAPWLGRILLMSIQDKAVRLLLCIRRMETCGTISGQASFSSSLNCLVYGFKSIPCFSFGSRNGDSIAYLGLCDHTHFLTLQGPTRNFHFVNLFHRQVDWLNQMCYTTLVFYGKEGRVRQ